MDARRNRLGEREALELAEKAKKIIVAKGAKVVTFEKGTESFDRGALLKAMLGPTGNLRAPAILKGKTLLIGFEAGTYDRVLG